MKNKNAISWIVAIIIIIVVPYLIVKIANDENDILRYFSFHVLVIIPLMVIGSRWYKKKLSGQSTREMIRSIIPFYRVINRIKLFFTRNDRDQSP